MKRLRETWLFIKLIWLYDFLFDSRFIWRFAKKRVRIFFPNASQNNFKKWKDSEFPFWIQTLKWFGNLILAFSYFSFAGVRRIGRNCIRVKNWPCWSNSGIAWGKSNDLLMKIISGWVGMKKLGDSSKTPTLHNKTFSSTFNNKSVNYSITKSLNDLLSPSSVIIHFWKTYLWW